MIRTLLCCLLLMLVATAASGEPEGSDGPDAPGKDGDKLLSGMSIVGNDEAPKSLVIVPWKSSDLGDTLEVSRALDNGRRPVDRDVFQRALGYYQIRSGAEAGPSAAEN